MMMVFKMALLTMTTMMTTLLRTVLTLVTILMMPTI